MKYLTEGQEVQEAEEVKMKDAKYSLITVITEKGCSDMVMDAAREVGARGGTVVHARGAGSEEAAQFFGITIQPEKEIIMILTPADKRTQIMEAITSMEDFITGGKGMIFTLPVTAVAGMGSSPDAD